MNKLNKYINLTENKKNNNWKEVENDFSIVFPSDYKDFIDLYGEGAINGFLWILSPFSEYDELNLLRRYSKMKAAFEEMKDIVKELRPYRFWCRGEGLFPFAVTDNGDELYWNFSENKIDIVVIASRYSKVWEFEGTFEEFLIKLVLDNSFCEIFPDDFIQKENFYEL